MGTGSGLIAPLPKSPPKIAPDTTKNATTHNKRNDVIDNPHILFSPAFVTGAGAGAGAGVALTTGGSVEPP